MAPAVRAVTLRVARATPGGVTVRPVVAGGGAEVAGPTMDRGTTWGMIMAAGGEVWMTGLDMTWGMIMAAGGEVWMTGRGTTWGMIMAAVGGVWMTDLITTSQMIEVAVEGGSMMDQIMSVATALAILQRTVRPPV